MRPGPEDSRSPEGDSGSEAAGARGEGRPLPDASGAAWTLFRPLDLLAAALLLGGAALALPRLAAPFGARAEVSVDGREVARLSLDGPRRTLAVPTALGPWTLAYGGGNVRVTEAPCANRLCVRAGAVARRGSSVVCLPARARITVTGGGEGDGVDAVTY